VRVVVEDLRQRPGLVGKTFRFAGRIAVDIAVLWQGFFWHEYEDNSMIRSRRV
jgi:hypothetical protein